MGEGAHFVGLGSSYLNMFLRWRFLVLSTPRYLALVILSRGCAFWGRASCSFLFSVTVSC